MAKARHEPDGDARFKLALFCDRLKKIHCRDGDMETGPMCGDLWVARMVNELFGKITKN
jgi:hypothetical protein